MPSTTPNFGFEYPLSTDNLSDGAQSIQDFATTADTTFADLKGGTTNQVLAKNSNTDMDFKWVTSASPIYFAPKSQEYWSVNSNILGTVTTAVYGSNRLCFVPIIIPEAMTVDRIGVFVTTAATGTTSRLAIYESSTTRNAPGALLLDAGTINTGTTGTKNITISQALNAGVYWLALLTIPATVAYTAIAGASPFFTEADAADLNTQTVEGTNHIQASSTVLPNPNTSTGWRDTNDQTARAPMIFLRRL